MLGGVREFGEEADDGIGVQQLGHAVGGALVAFEVEAALLTVPGGNQDDPAVGDQCLEDGQGVGGGHPAALAVLQRARHPDEGDTVEVRRVQCGEPGAQGRLVQKRRDLGAQPAGAGKFGADQRPVLQDIHLGLHLDGTIIVLVDHPGDHDVADIDARLLRQRADLDRLIDGVLRPPLHIRWDEFERDGVERHERHLIDSRRVVNLGHG